MSNMLAELCENLKREGRDLAAVDKVIVMVQEILRGVDNNWDNIQPVIGSNFMDGPLVAVVLTHAWVGKYDCTMNVMENAAWQFDTSPIGISVPNTPDYQNPKTYDEEIANIGMDYSPDCYDPSVNWKIQVNESILDKSNMLQNVLNDDLTIETNNICNNQNKQNPQVEKTSEPFCKKKSVSCSLSPPPSKTSNLSFSKRKRGTIHKNYCKFNCRFCPSKFKSRQRLSKHLAKFHQKLLF